MCITADCSLYILCIFTILRILGRGRGRRGLLLLANLGCFKTVLLANGLLWCGVLRVFCDVLRVCCECFVSDLHYFHKTHTKHKKTRKTLENTKNSQYARVLRIVGVFQEQEPKIATVLHKTHLSQNTKHLQNSAKHRKTKHKTLAKQSQNAFCEITAQNTVKRTQNAAQKRHKTLTIQTQCVLRAFGVFSKNALDLSRKHTIRNIRLNYGGGVTYPQEVTSQDCGCFSKTGFCGVLQCFVVFCGVLGVCF